MAYNGWKMMDKVTVAIKTVPDNPNYGRTFNGFVADANDVKSVEAAKDWARGRAYDYEKREYTELCEPEIYTFDNDGFSVKILKSAGGSSQGGRLSFLACEVEKGGVKFVIGVNDALLVDLIRNSDIHNGEIKQKVMFVRRGGQPGFIHEDMEAYKEAIADMKQKAELKSAKKTSKWEIGGVYSTLTQEDICLGEVWDTMEEVTGTGYTGWYPRTKLVLRDKPVLVTAWISAPHSGDAPTNFDEVLRAELASDYVYLRTGKPPARTKSRQLDVGEVSYVLLDKLLKKRVEYTGYNTTPVSGRYVRRG